MKVTLNALLSFGLASLFLLAARQAPAASAPGSEFPLVPRPLFCARRFLF